MLTRTHDELVDLAIHLFGIEVMLTVGNCDNLHFGC